MYLSMNLDSVYYMWLPLSIEYLPMKARFIPLEANMDEDAVALRCAWPQDNQKQQDCQG